MVIFEETVETLRREKGLAAAQKKADGKKNKPMEGL